MTRYRVCISLLALAVLFPLCLAQVNQDSEPRWQRDWQAFGQAIAPYSRRGALESPGGGYRERTEFNRVFSRTVRWIGRVREVNAYRVKLAMETIRIPLRDGTRLPISELTLECESGGCAQWTGVTPGSRVEFRTTLENRTRGIRPVVEVIGRGARRNVMIQARGAELVQVLPEQ